MAYDDAWLAQQLQRPGYHLVQGTLSTPLQRGAPEMDLEERVRQLCEATGHLRYHTRKSVGSTHGFPDDAIVKETCDRPEGSTLHLWELKREGETESPAQRRWREALQQVTRVDVQVYWPADIERIAAVLTTRRRHG
jgi:hypothetical protein